MKPASPKLIAMLQALYFDEKVVEAQYLAHYATTANRGLSKFAAQILEQAGEERKHADVLAARIALFEALPTPYGGKCDPTIGVDIGCEAMLEAELPLEIAAIAKYEAGIKLCVEVGDNDTRDLLVANLKDETHHVHEIETDLNLIELIGLDNWASAMI